MFLFGWTTSSYLSVLNPTLWTPHGRVLKVRCPQICLTPSKSSYFVYLFLFDNTKPVWTPHGRAKDVLKGIVYQFLFDWHNTCLNTPWTSKWCPQRDPLQVPIWVSSKPYLNTPWTCKRCPQSDRLPVPIWLTQNLFEHPMDVQKMSSKGSSTSSYLTDTTPVWTPHGRPNDVLKGILYKFLFECPNPIWTPHGRATDVLKVIVYQFLLDWHNTCLNTPWTSKRCPQSDPLQVPIWVS